MAPSRTRLRMVLTEQPSSSAALFMSIVRTLVIVTIVTTLTNLDTKKEHRYPLQVVKLASSAKHKLASAVQQVMGKRKA